MAKPDSDQEVGEGPLVDVGGGVMLPAFELAPDVPQTAVDGGGAPPVVDTSPAGIIATIDAAIAAGGDVASYTVNGRTVVLRSLDHLLRVRDYYVAEQARRSGLRRTRAFFP